MAMSAYDIWLTTPPEDPPTCSESCYWFEPCPCGCGWGICNHHDEGLIDGDSFSCYEWERMEDDD